MSPHGLPRSFDASGGGGGGGSGGGGSVSGVASAGREGNAGPAIELAHQIDFKRDKCLLIRGWEVLPSWQGWMGKATANASSAAVDVKATAKAKKLHASSLGDGIGTIVDAVPERELAFVKKNPQSCFLIIACGEEEETESAITSTTIEAYLVQCNSTADVDFWYGKLEAVVSDIQVAKPRG
mgnify:CR=1 FL=1|jgi:hypothetical protein